MDLIPNYLRLQFEQACANMKKQVKDYHNKENTMETIAPTNVIAFHYTNAKIDYNPIVLVTHVEVGYIGGYNLNYYNDSGLTYRKYTRSFMENIKNLTNEIIPAHPKDSRLVDHDKGPKIRSLKEMIMDCAEVYENTYADFRQYIIRKDVENIVIAATLAEAGDYRKCLRKLQGLDTIVRDHITDEVWDALQGATGVIV